MDLVAPVDDTFDETIYAVVSTGKAIETTATSDLFQTSFRTLLDGSEFMKGIFEKNDTDKDEDEEDQMDAAIRTGMKMARRCSCPSVGSYQPFDAADPTTWKKKRNKSPRRQRSKSPIRKKKEQQTGGTRMPERSKSPRRQRSKSPVRKKKEKQTSKTRIHERSKRRSSAPSTSKYETRIYERSKRRSSAPSTSKHVPQILEQANEDRKKEEKLYGEEKSSDHRRNSLPPNGGGEKKMYQTSEKRIHGRSQRRSSAPMTSSYVLQLLEQENEDRKNEYTGMMGLRLGTDSLSSIGEGEEEIYHTSETRTHARSHRRSSIR